MRLSNDRRLNGMVFIHARVRARVRDPHRVLRHGLRPGPCHDALPGLRGRARHYPSGVPFPSLSSSYAPSRKEHAREWVASGDNPVEHRTVRGARG